MNLPSSLRRLPITLAAALPMVAAATNGYFSHGFGVKNEALAGAGIAFSQDGLAIATNPAGLVDVADGLDAGLVLFHPSRGSTITVEGSGSQHFSGNGTKNFGIPSLGYARKLNERVTLGIALYGNGGLNTDYGTSPFGAPGEAGVDISQAFLSPAVAIQVGEHQSLGLAVNIAYQRFKAKGLAPFGPYSQDADNLSNRGYDDSWGYGARLGYQVHVTDRLTLGATWQSRTKASRFRKYQGLFADGGDFDVPATYGLGAALRVADGWRVALDWQRIEYSKIHSVGNSIQRLLVDSVPLCADDGPGFGWRDVSVIKLGTQVELSPQLTLRGGVSTNRQPVRRGETFFNTLAPGVVSTHATLGASWRLGGKSELSLSYLHAFRKTVKGENSIPPPFVGGADAEADVRLTEDSLGIGYSYRF